MYQSQRCLVIYPSQKCPTPAAAEEVGHRLVHHRPPGHIGGTAAVAQVVAHDHIDSAAAPRACIASSSSSCYYLRCRRRAWLARPGRCSVVVEAVCPDPGLCSGLLGVDIDMYIYKYIYICLYIDL